MRRFVLSLIFCLAAVSSVFASLVPFYDPFYDNTDIFRSPAWLSEGGEVPAFAFEISAYSAVDYLSYLSNPAAELSEYSDYLYSRMIEGDEAFWQQYAGSLGSIFSFDSSSNIPSGSASVGQIRAYLEDSYANRFTKEHKARAVLNALSSTDLLSGADPLYSDAVLSLSLNGGALYDSGFAWQISSHIGFTGGNDMLSDPSLLNVDIRGDVGYAFHIFSERVTLGMSLEALALMQNQMLGLNLLDARFSNDPITAFSEPFKFGLGFSLNFGSMYRHSDELAFTLDLTNVASFRKFYDIPLEGFADFNGFTEDENVYYQPMDLILRAVWTSGPWMLTVEFSDVVNQVIWAGELDGYKYDFFSIPKLAFSCDVTQDLSLGARLGFSRLAFLLEWKSLNVEITSALDKLAFGLSVGMKF